MAERVQATMACVECGRMFTRLVWTTSHPKYCTKACKMNADARRLAMRLREQKIAAGKFGRFGLEYDPWKTGQLPETVTRNALWRAE